MTVHALARAKQRFPAEVARIERAAEKVARNFPDVAVASRIARISYPRSTGIGPDGRRKSNGDEVWVIARLGVVETVMLRRSTQLHNPEAFDVDVVAFGLRVQATDMDVAA
jgi:hypothetical protein